ncbi:MAG TPA: type II secretion system secretin GspD [Kofleriaceae bacterium]|nr:type II secretion system secretin GspD [Kofleriaceae bacterium]
MVAFTGIRQARAETAAIPPAAAPATAPGEDAALYSCKQHTTSVVVSFKAEAEVKELITWVVGFTCKSFLIDPRIVATGRKVSIVTPNQMTPAEAYRVFLGALATVGLTVVPKGNALRVVESATARKEALPLQHRGQPDDLEQVVRYVYKPSYVAAEPLHQAWMSLRSDAGDVFTLGSVIVVTDYASNVREMLAFAHLVDVAGGSDAIYTIPVHHADAGKLSEKINGILGIAPGAAPAAPRPTAPAQPVAGEAAMAVPSKIMVDERTNTLLVAASEAGYQRVKALVDRLDIALEIEGGNSIHVYPLGSAIADELAKTLTTAIGDGKQAARPPGAPITTTIAPVTPATPAPAASPLDGLGAVLEGQVRVIADPPTNALIVLASGRDFLAIKDVIRQLDQPRRQVYIEAMIFEVSLDNAGDLGAAGHAGTSLGSASGPVLLGSVQSDVNSLSLQSAVTTPGALNGLLAGVVSPTTSLLGLSIPSYTALFRALATSNHSNILSEPSIIAVDNVEAKYKVGITIPVGDGQQTLGGITNNGTSATPLTTTHFTEQELPLTLNIKPHISNNDLILLEVTHEAKELISTTQSTNGATWSTRSFETRVVVRDQQTVVLGGLTQDTEAETTTQVPLLGDIPLLGYLFKSRHKERHKTNLLVMLTPHIIKDQLDLQAIQDRKLRQHDEMLSSITALDHMKYEPVVDYRRKRGLVEEINRALQDVDEDAAQRAAILAPRGVELGNVAPPAPPPEPAK